jgi:flagellar basal-body rod protein FlgC
MDLVKALKISASGMKAQGTRLRVISENLANAQSTATSPGEEPYRRKIINFKNVFDRVMGANLVRVSNPSEDKSAFGKRYDPAHPAADGQGYIQLPNVKPLVEMMDMRESQRSYEANLSVITATKGMLQRTIELLRS